MVRGYISRHDRPHHGGTATGILFSKEASEELSQISKQQGDERLQFLRNKRGQCTQAEWQEIDNLRKRQEENRDTSLQYCRALLEGFFQYLDLAPLPPPLCKSHSLYEVRSANEYNGRGLEEIIPFINACEEGLLKEVELWVQDETKREALQPIGLQDGLDIAAHSQRLDIVRYLLDQDVAKVSTSLIQAACRHGSLPLFEMAVKHGYHPNQQAPFPGGTWGVALPHCIDNSKVTHFLLEHGADPDLAPLADPRKSVWEGRAAPPMDRTSGLALDRAVDRGSNLVVIQDLLDHGAKLEYARPLHGVITRLKRERQKEHGEEDADSYQEECYQWRSLMEFFLRAGANINAKTWRQGTPLMYAVFENMWDVAEFLLDHGADPKAKRRYLPGIVEDAFAVAAKVTGEQNPLVDMVENKKTVRGLPG